MDVLAARRQSLSARCAEQLSYSFATRNRFRRIAPMFETDLGNVLAPMTPGDFGKLMADETEKWGKVIRAASIKIRSLGSFIGNTRYMRINVNLVTSILLRLILTKCLSGFPNQQRSCRLGEEMGRKGVSSDSCCDDWLFRNSAERLCAERRRAARNQGAQSRVL